MTYRYETIEYPIPKSRLDVDAAYVILAGPDDGAEMKKDLAVLHPCRTVHLLHAPILSTSCYLSVFRDSLERKYDRILVLADARFLQTTLLPEDIRDINAFLNDQSSEPHVYALGCLPLFMLPARHQAYRTLGLGVCAAVYSKSFRQLFLQEAGDTAKGHWDLVLLRTNALYVYAKPLFCSVKYKPIMKAIGLWYECAKITVYITLLIALGLFWALFHYDQVYAFLRTYARMINVCGYTLDPVLEKLKPILFWLRPSSLQFP